MAIKQSIITKDNIKFIIYIVGIVLTIFFFFRDKAVKDALLKSQLETTIQNQRNIMEKLKEIDAKFDIQSELNGRTIEHLSSSH